MSVAKEAKQKEWSCNIFSQSREEQPLFARKRKSDTSHSNDSFRSASNESTDFLNKRSEGDLFLYRTLASQTKPSRCLTPSFGSSVSKRSRDSISMQKILQPYLALDLIIATKDGGYAPRDFTSKCNKETDTITN